MTHPTPQIVLDNMNENTSQEDESTFEASQALHLHKISEKRTQSEEVAASLCFGDVTNSMIPMANSESYLEMDTEEAAAKTVKHCSLTALQHHSQPVHVEYPEHQGFRTDNLPSQDTAQAELPAVTDVLSESPHADVPEDISEFVPDNFSRFATGQSCILRMIVENPYYPVTVDGLYQIFSTCGSVLKIIIFIRDNLFQVLLQYADHLSASYALGSLNGRNIYPACCRLLIKFSRLTNLVVRYNNEKSRDFTRPDLPSGIEHSWMRLDLATQFGIHNVSPYAEAPYFPHPMGFPQYDGPMHPPVPGQTPPLSGIPQEAHLQVPAPVANDFSINCVLLVTNLNTEVITPYRLFILFGVYGDVQRVKIMFNRRQNALIQMANQNQAQLAINYLNGQKLYGRVLCVLPSKHRKINLPREGCDNQEMTQDYRNSPLHRFKYSRNLNRLFPPSSILHLSNIRPSSSPEDLQSLFTDKGFTVKRFRYYDRVIKSALIELLSVEDAVQALIELQYHDLGENYHLQITFSKHIA